MTTLYLIRHGESEANRADAFLGHGDLPLTDTGCAQGRAAANHLQHVGAHAIYASDLMRARQTAQFTADLLGLPVTQDQRLREIHAGAWEFQRFDDIITNDDGAFACWVKDFGHAVCPGGESVLQLQSRFVSALRDIASRHDGQTVLIFTHATPVRVAAAHCLGKSPDTMGEVPWAGNTSVTRISVEDGAFTLEEYGFNDFLGDLITVLPPNV